MSHAVCLYWVFTNTAWSSAEWTWEDCQLLSDICATWGTENVWWKNVNWQWNQCPEIQSSCIKWGTADFGWGSANWQWNECSSSVIPPIPPTSSVYIQPLGVDATTLVQPWITEPWNPYRAGEIDKKKRLIKLICKVKGQTYEEEKEVGDMNVSVDDIKMVVKKILDIDLDVKME